MVQRSHHCKNPRKMVLWLPNHLLQISHLVCWELHSLPLSHSCSYSSLPRNITIIINCTDCFYTIALLPCSLIEFLKLHICFCAFCFSLLLAPAGEDLRIKALPVRPLPPMPVRSSRMVSPQAQGTSICSARTLSALCGGCSSEPFKACWTLIMCAQGPSHLLLLWFTHSRKFHVNLFSVNEYSIFNQVFFFAGVDYY